MLDDKSPLKGKDLILDDAKRIGTACAVLRLAALIG